MFSLHEIIDLSTYFNHLLHGTSVSEFNLEQLSAMESVIANDILTGCELLTSSSIPYNYKA